MKKTILVALISVVLALAAGCDMFPVPPDPYASPTPTESPAATPAETDEADPTDVATPTPTVQQTTSEPTATPTVAPTPVPTPTPDPTEGMIFPDSDERLLTWDELIKLKADKLDLARNEIFARAGYKFTKDHYIDYYGKLDWYEEDPDFKESDFTEIQRANVTLIRTAEYAIKGQLMEIKTGTVLDYDQDGDLEMLTFSSPDENHMNLKIKDGTTTTSWNIECELPTKKVFLGDINFTDGILDLFVDENGPSDDFLVYVSGIKNKAFLNRGTIPGRIGQLKLDKKGAIATNRRMSILMTWFCNVKYKLNSAGKLTFVEQASYSMGNYKCKTKVALPLKSKAESSSAVAFTVPAGTEVTLVSTDDKKWIKIKAPAGEAWLEMVDSITLKDPNISGIDAFDGLLLAD